MLFPSASTILSPQLLAAATLLAQEGETPKGYNISWAIVMLCVVLGMMLTLRGSKREAIEEKQPGA